MTQLLLASKSPRRRELLENLGLSITVAASNAHTLKAFDGDETVKAGELPADYAERIAWQKFAEGLAKRDAMDLPNTLPVLASDTVVSLGDAILGKPADFNEACQFLTALSGVTHEVRTVVVVGKSLETAHMRVSVSKVHFKDLTQAEIEKYCHTDEPYDKAGGYGIQGLAGVFIDRIEGSFTGIMGLPLFETAELLKEEGIVCL